MASLLNKLWARFCPKQIPLSIMIVGLDNSGKTSILNALASTNSYRASNATAPPTPRSQSPNVTAQRGQTNDPIEPDNNIAFDLGGCKKDMKSMETSSSKQSEINLGSNDIRICLDNNDACGGGGNLMPTVGYNYERLQYKSLAITVLDFSGQNKYRGLWQEFYNGIDGIVFVIDSSDLIRLVVVRDELENMLSHPYFATLEGSNSSPSGQLLASSSPFTPSSSSSTMMFNSASGQTQFFPDHQTATQMSPLALAQKQLIISQGKLIQQPLDTVPLVNHSSGGGASGYCGDSQKDQRLRASSSGSRSSRTLHTSSTSARKRTKVPILFLANKADLANSTNIEVITKTLDLNQLPIDRHPWIIRATSVNQNQGIQDSFDWLISQLLIANVANSTKA